MLLSRCSTILKVAKNLKSARPVTPNFVPARLSHKCWYREPGGGTRSQVITAEILGGIMWWWVLWHIYHEPDHLFGEWDFPDRLKWTDAELGIPPEDAD